MLVAEWHEEGRLTADVGAFELKQGVISSYLACFAESVPHILFLVDFLLH